MKVTGYQLRSALRLHDLRSKTAIKSFPTSLQSFKDDPRQPEAEAKRYYEAEAATARIQEAQMKYNLAVSVTVEGQTMSLALAIKNLGPINRVAKLWREAAGDKTERYYDRQPTERDKDKEYTTPNISRAEIMNLAERWARKSQLITAAIANANTTEVDIDLDPKLLE